MAWVRLDDAVYDHPKLAGVPNGTLWVWVCGLAYASRHLTDGFVPSGVLRRFNATSRDAGRLVRAGLWKPVDGGWQIHDYGDYQPTRGSVNGSRADLSRKRSEAGRKGAQARWQKDGKP